MILYLSCKVIQTRPGGYGKSFYNKFIIIGLREAFLHVGDDTLFTKYPTDPVSSKSLTFIYLPR